MSQENTPAEGGQQVQIKMSDEVAKGVYSNMVQVGFTHSGEEFVLDFFQLVPPLPQAVARVILSPSHAKRILGMLQENLQRYEDKYGTISLAVVPDQKIGFKTE